ncbi:MAG: hypothetical protein Q7R66_08095 [Undibacterium sp.]|uniref:L,D-transpeptidase Cds6 family protein n=1 Tax=Undibacterium sp. TaxID=1914977 RepID=UPI00271E771D|nr:hypothetical protein [Undibacterium sp.]MDO8652133.1 hypothetical protein [Undibacterium sp.]
MGSLLKTFSTCTLLLTMTACASFTHESDQQIHIATYDQNGVKVKGASCKLSNDFRQSTIDTLEPVKVHRSYSDLMIECKKPGYADANARVVSSVNAGMYGNILTAGIGALFDHSTGAAYTYPQQMNLVFGKTLNFDRRSDKVGQLSVATDIPKKKDIPAVASTPPASNAAATVPAQAKPETTNVAQNTSEALKVSRTAALTALAKWRAAWVSMNPPAYFELYAKNYTSNAPWKAARQARLLGAEKIYLDLTDIKVNLQDAKHLTISFHQEYRSPSYKDALEKILYWEEVDGSWLIVNEAINPGQNNLQNTVQNGSQSGSQRGSQNAKL